MKDEVTKNLTYYESLPYTITLRKDNEGDFVARIAELPGCLAHGSDGASALASLRSMQKLWLEDALATGEAIPEPEDDESLPSGKWLQRVPRRLHRDLVHLARRDNVSLNQLVTSMLSEAVTAKSCAHTFEVYLSNISLQPRPVKNYINYLHWHNPMEPYGQDVAMWSTTPHAQTGNILERLALVKNLAPGYHPFDEATYIDEHTESRKPVARK